MSERYPATIQIGGPLPKRFVKPLAKALLGDGLLNSDFDMVGDEAGYVKILERAAKAKEFARFGDDQASYGTFESLESFLSKHKIAFRRQSDAYMEFDGEIVVFRPDKGQKYPINCEGTQNGTVLVPLEFLKKNQNRSVISIIAEFDVFEAKLPALEIV
jgi:hypothetical protein